MRKRHHGQAVVEFGVIAVLFALMMFAVVDFGLLLNNWLSVTSGVRLLARDAAVGMYAVDLDAEAHTLKIPGVTADPHFSGRFCCGPGSALVLSVTYYDQCTPGVVLPGVLPCVEVPIRLLDSNYSSGGVPGGCTHPCPRPDRHPSPPRANGACSTGLDKPCPGDSVVVTLTAAGAQVITPLVRPFFAKANECPDNSTPSRCYVSLSSTVVMRFEGDTL